MGRVIRCTKCGKKFFRDDGDDRLTCKECEGINDEPRVHTGRPGVSGGGFVPYNKVIPES